MLYLNNIPASDVGVIVEHRPRRPVPRRKSYAWDVPGRGRILRQLDAWENVTLQYDLAVLPLPGTSLEATVDLAVGWLNQGGYMRLWDDTDPLVYYLAAFPGGADLEPVLHRARRARVSFDARPERFLLSGEAEVYDRGLVNPTAYPSRPRLRFFGPAGFSGTVIINDKRFPVNSGTAVSIYGFIDSDSRTTSNGISISGDFPTLAPGQNTVSLTGSVNTVLITPRWYEL